MSIAIILRQMAVIALLVILGYILQKRDVLDKNTVKKLSVLVINICNPALGVACYVENEVSVSHMQMIQAVLISIAIYAVLIGFGFILPSALRIEKGKRKFYNMMTVYTNIGFMGIPLARAILDDGAMVYVIIFNVLFSVFFYTHGYAIMGMNKEKNKKNFINAGLVCGVLTILLFWVNIPIPDVLGNTFIYVGDATTFLAMAMLGASIAETPLKSMFSEYKTYFFIVLKMIVMPVAAAAILAVFHVDGTMITALTLMLSMPAASMPLMLAQMNGDDTAVLSHGISATTIMSFITVTVVMVITSYLKISPF